MMPVNATTERLPQRGNWLTRGFCALGLRLGGWSIEGDVPQRARFVVVVGPHTSNWDFIWGMLILGRLGVRMRFLIKKDVFVFGFGAFLRFLGAIPVDRRAGASAFQAAIDSFNSHPDGQVLVITPEGTRRNKTSLKQGFYTIARRAGVPVLPCSLDYATKTATLYEFIEVAEMPFPAVEAHLDAKIGGIKGRHGYWMDRTPDAD